MGPVFVNGSIHSASKQHQRKNVPICVRIASRVLCGLGLNMAKPKLLFFCFFFLFSPPCCSMFASKQKIFEFGLKLTFFRNVIYSDCNINKTRSGQASYFGNDIHWLCSDSIKYWFSFRNAANLDLKCHWGIVLVGRVGGWDEVMSRHWMSCQRQI